MLYLFSGSDTEKTRAKAFQWVASARGKAPEAPYLRISSSELSAEMLGEAAGLQGLFFSKTLVLIDDPFAEKEKGDILLEHLALLAKSPNPIAVLAPKLLASRLKKISGVAEKTFLFEKKEKAPMRGFNAPLVNALAAKDGRMLWQEIVFANRQGDAPEMIHGLLHFKARDLMQRGGGKWGVNGARELSLRLIELVSDSRSGELPLSENLERFALSLDR